MKTLRRWLEGNDDFDSALVNTVLSRAHIGGGVKYSDVRHLATCCRIDFVWLFGYARRSGIKKSFSA